MWEFDLWVTPSISDIRSTARYKAEMSLVLLALDVFSRGEDLTLKDLPSELTDRVLQDLDSRAAGQDNVEARKSITDILNALSALLFLVTGKSDNNQKCQLPIFLRNTLGWNAIAGAKRVAGKPVLCYDPIPRVLDSTKYLGRVISLYLASLAPSPINPGTGQKFRHDAALLLYEFIKFLLSDEASQQQLSAFISHYRRCIATGEDPSLLFVPLVIFQVRGSVAASGGHEPEELLRDRMTEWGLRRGIDFNLMDVIVDSRVGGLLEADDPEVEGALLRKQKTRAYDFVIPFRTYGWRPRIFIQSQFYAGDSGSVSHKNVDQTRASRQSTGLLASQVWPDTPPPHFVEYVDGAGYCASLNGDLKSLLSYHDTSDFFQIRSAPLRLRRLIQDVGFLTPLDLGHAILRAEGNLEQTHAILTDEGYTYDEINRCVDICRKSGLVHDTGNAISLNPEVTGTFRRYLLLDAIAVFGEPFATLEDCKGVALIPGFGPYYGIHLSRLGEIVASRFSRIWPQAWLPDFQTLCDLEMVILK